MNCQAKAMPRMPVTPSSATPFSTREPRAGLREKIIAPPLQRQRQRAGHVVLAPDAEDHERKQPERHAGAALSQHAEPHRNQSGQKGQHHDHA
ncbi:hypothetical protein G6F57_016661 [Rhizopus arrhizus]|nr:hypothetical protein G6F57_016661 [Rhizopus arrhizus]